MASTNKTTHYELSQYIGSDKPTYLGDYNSDMNKIDTQMYVNATNTQLALTNASNAQDGADSAEQLATTANNSANSALSVANTANTVATQNATNIGQMSALTTDDKSSLVSALNEVNTTASSVNTLENQFNALIDDLYYKVGDIVQNSYQVGGYVTGTSRRFYCEIYVPKSLKNIRSITCSGGSFILRTTSGGYLDNKDAGIQYNESGYTLTLGKLDDHAIYLQLDKTTGAMANVVNNTPCAGAISQLRLTFN